MKYCQMFIFTVLAAKPGSDCTGLERSPKPYTTAEYSRLTERKIRERIKHIISTANILASITCFLPFLVVLITGIMPCWCSFIRSSPTIKRRINTVIMSPVKSPVAAVMPWVLSKDTGVPWRL